MSIRAIILVLLISALAQEAPAQDVPDLAGELWGSAPPVKPERVTDMIGDTVERILARQKDDGSFPLFAKNIENFTLGQTALAAAALQYALPHLKGNLRERADKAVARGVDLIAKSKPEALTYSAGLVLCVLQRDDAEKHRELIDAYARLLIGGQIEKGPRAGMWAYRLKMTGGRTAQDVGDNSNTQFAVLGLHAATRAGYQAPVAVWERVRDHYLATQTADGGWGYRPGEAPTSNMTVAGTVSLQVAEDILGRQAPGSRLQASGTAEEEKAEAAKDNNAMPGASADAVQKGLRWLAARAGSGKVGTETYGLYALERLGILMGRANLGRYDWYAEGVRRLASREWTAAYATEDVAACFGVMFLSAGLDPVVINKLERPADRNVGATPDWDRHPRDVSHLVEYIQDTQGKRIQWRIVTLEAPLDLLKQTPILYITGSKALAFTNEESAKLKSCVDAGGAILAVADEKGEAFDASLRAWVRETFGRDLARIDDDHPLHEMMRTKAAARPGEVWLLPGEGERERPLVVYLPTDLARLWDIGGSRAKEALTAGAGIYRFVTETADPFEKEKEQ